MTLRDMPKLSAMYLVATEHDNGRNGRDRKTTIYVESFNWLARKR